ncbi:hypothetical protein Q5Y75_11995 [Ruegeria sp. 2205SS24-7]|nr:hypothetical protein [Ruegeria sp. 2205SS24-7]MDP5217942.1 hypothetical protein [Ruegeria sp. 2205SS24-7]
MTLILRRAPEMSSFRDISLITIWRPELQILLEASLPYQQPARI